MAIVWAAHHDWMDFASKEVEGTNGMVVNGEDRKSHYFLGHDVSLSTRQVSTIEQNHSASGEHRRQRQLILWSNEQPESNNISGCFLLMPLTLGPRST